MDNFNRIQDNQTDKEYIDLGDLRDITDINTIDLKDFTFNVKDTKGDAINIDFDAISISDSISIIDPDNKDDTLSIMSDRIFDNFSNADVIEINDGNVIIIDETPKKKGKSVQFLTSESVQRALQTYILVPDISKIKFSEFIRYFRIEKNGKRILRNGGQFVKDTKTHIFLVNYGRVWRTPKKITLYNGDIIRTPFYVQPDAYLKDGTTMNGRERVRFPTKRRKKGTYDNIVIVDDKR